MEDLAPDMSNLMEEEMNFVIKVFYDGKEIFSLPARASSTQDLREKYIKMFGKLSTNGEEITVKVYRKDEQGELHLVAEHLF